MSRSSQRAALFALLRGAGEPRTVARLVREHMAELVVGEGPEAFAAALKRVGAVLVGLRREKKVVRRRVAGRVLWSAIVPGRCSCEPAALAHDPECLLGQERAESRGHAARPGGEP